MRIPCLQLLSTFAKLSHVGIGMKQGCTFLKSRSSAHRQPSIKSRRTHVLSMLFRATMSSRCEDARGRDGDGTRGLEGNKRVAGFVVSGVAAAMSCHHHAAPLRPHQDLVLHTSRKRSACCQHRTILPANSIDGMHSMDCGFANDTRIRCANSAIPPDTDICSGRRQD